MSMPMEIGSGGADGLGWDEPPHCHGNAQIVSTNFICAGSFRLAELSECKVSLRLSLPVHWFLIHTVQQVFRTDCDWRGQPQAFLVVAKPPLISVIAATQMAVARKR